MVLRCTFTLSLLIVLSSFFLMSSADDDLKCYHCTKEITLVNGKNKTTIHKFNNDTKVTECDEKTCTEDEDECYEVTTKDSNVDEETSISVHSGCFTSKDAVCDLVSKLNPDKCKNEWTWETCDKDLCNKGSAISPRILATGLLIVLALRP